MATTTVKAPTKSKPKTSKKETKKPRAYPSYHEMVKEAISALKERTGSSQIAVAKYIEEKQKNLPANFKKLLSVQLKKLVADGRLVKVKNSYKLPPKTASAAPAVKPAKKVDPKPKPQTAKTMAVTAKKPSKAAPAKKKVKTPVKAVKKPKSLKSPAKGVKKTTKKA